MLGVTDVGAYFPHRVTYHPTCHSLRMLRRRRPAARGCCARSAGIELVELPTAEECCGFGGTFAVKNADTSIAMVADKARHVRDTGAEVLVAGDNSCLMHIGGVLSRQRAGVRAMHLAEILAATEDSESPAVRTGRRRATQSDRAMTAPSSACRPSRPPPARRSATPSCAATCAHATRTIRAKRAAVVAEVADWEELRLAGAAIKERTLRDLADPPRAPRGSR